ncbi:MAG TPA: FtsQ-type POTRA domain-containing protein [Frankiaceae bacterium]|nr:FtsQ-type POTRA domain-containing protein [Frankiaceae bacterium]
MRWRRVAAAAGAAAAVLMPAWGPPLLRPFGFFRVRRIELVGVQRMAPAVVVRALGLAREASVWDRLGRPEAQVRALPGVADAEVTRRLPATLRVTVREVEPMALAAGPWGLVPVGPDARPLPYDLAGATVDAPVVRGAQPAVVSALVALRGADPSFYSEVVAARSGPAGSVELELEGGGRVRLALPVDAAVVRSVAAVERDLASRAQAWRELDGRFGGWVVVRGATRAEAKS